MFGKLARSKNIILIIFAVVWAVTFALALFFDSRENKTVVLVLSVVGPLIIYGFIKLMFKIMRKVAYPQYVKVIVRLILAVAIIGVVIMLINFIIGFPNALSPSLPMGMATVIAMLEEEKKNALAKTKE